MKQFNILLPANPLWDQIVRRAYLYDFHHTGFYHQIDNQDQSRLFVATRGDDFIALPLVFRTIPETDWADATSVYGYCGPLANEEGTFQQTDLVDYFWKELTMYFKENSIISAFSRLHPLINQHLFFEDHGEIRLLNKTVSINLKLDPDEQRRQYRKSNKSEINQLRRKGFVVEKAESVSDIDRFIEIYYETMDRVEASSNYYFTREYFRRFLNNPAFDNQLLLAKFDGEIAAGAIFTMTDKIMQYHLAGTTERYIRETPMKLILDEARLLGNEKQLDYLHLGGGVGGSDDDSLFRFKSGFSKQLRQFSVWKYIIDREKYDSLVQVRKIQDVTSGFFPLYRIHPD